MIVIVMKLDIANPQNSKPVKAFEDEGDARAYCGRENRRQNDFYYLFYHLNVE